MKLQPQSYADAKKLLDNGNCLAEVVDLSGLSYSTCRIIKKSKNYKSYDGLVRNNHLTKAQKALVNKGFTVKEARRMETVQKPQPGKHELSQEPIVAKIDKHETLPPVTVPATDQQITALTPSQSTAAKILTVAGRVILIASVAVIIYGIYKFVVLFL